MSEADLLRTIVAATRKSVATREGEIPIDVLRQQIRRRPRGDAFAGALRRSQPPRVIAECKRRSPSRGILRGSYDAPSLAVAYARAGAAAISVITEPTFFDGAPDHLADVRAVVDLPLLRKDFTVDRYQLVESAVLGADAVLLIAGALEDSILRSLIAESRDLGLAALVEVHDAVELERAVDAGAEIVGVNSRNLRTLAVEPAVLDTLIQRMPRHVIAIAESGIREPGDLERLGRMGYHAFLVGERLIAQADPGVALRELRALSAADGTIEGRR
jgi:indole-3-glycerol phosphate synthase